MFFSDESCERKEEFSKISKPQRDENEPSPRVSFCLSLSSLSSRQRSFLSSFQDLRGSLEESFGVDTWHSSIVGYRLSQLSPRSSQMSSQNQTSKRRQRSVRVLWLTNLYPVWVRSLYNKDEENTPSHMNLSWTITSVRPTSFLPPVRSSVLKLEQRCEETMSRTAQPCKCEKGMHMELWFQIREYWTGKSSLKFSLLWESPALSSLLRLAASKIRF